MFHSVKNETSCPSALQVLQVKVFFSTPEYLLYLFLQVKTEVLNSVSEEGLALKDPLPLQPLAKPELQAPLCPSILHLLSLFSVQVRFKTFPWAKKSHPPTWRCRPSWTWRWSLSRPPTGTTSSTNSREKLVHPETVLEALYSSSSSDDELDRKIEEGGDVLHCPRRAFSLAAVPCSWSKLATQSREPGSVCLALISFVCLVTVWLLSWWWPPESFSLNTGGQAHPPGPPPVDPAGNMKTLFLELLLIQQNCFSL